MLGTIQRRGNNAAVMVATVWRNSQRSEMPLFERIILSMSLASAGAQF